MNAKIVVPVIGFVATLTVSVISLITAMLTSRQSGRNTERIESMREDFARRRSAEAIEDEELKASLQALENVLAAIQHMKDQVQLILGEVESSMDVRTAVSRVSSARESIMQAYQKEHGHFDNVEIEAGHKAKNTAVLIEQVLMRALSSKESALELDKDIRATLLGLRAELTEHQQQLRDSRLERIVQRKYGV